MCDDSSQRRLTDLGWCRLCGRTVHAASLSDDVSHCEYTSRSGACQPCQDALSLNADAADRAVVAPVLHGVVLGAVVEESRVRELALLPFQYDPWYDRFEYEPGDLVCAGPVLEPVHPLAELGGIRPVWAGRRERVLILDSLADPLLRLRLERNHLILALDAATADVASELSPTLRRPPLVDLSAVVCWDEFGGSLGELLRANAPDRAVCFTSALHQCACVARLLQIPALSGDYAGCDLFDHVLLRAVVPVAAAVKEASGASCH